MLADLSTDADLAVDGARLVRRLSELADIGAIEGTEGCARLALTDEDRAGRELVTAWMGDLGLTVVTDGIGNTFGVLGTEGAGRPSDRQGAGRRWGSGAQPPQLGGVLGTEGAGRPSDRQGAGRRWGSGAQPPQLGGVLGGDDVDGAVLTGSHIDTVGTGGRYDGNLGVLAGLEVLETVIGRGLHHDRPLAVCFFTNEEGARFAPDMLGSLVYAGGMALEEALGVVAIDGAVLGDELDRIGARGAAPLPGPAPAAFVELHIEQGPVLEAEGVTIGAVTGVQGISWTQYVFTGQSNHAGTTPMAHRHDAGLAAARLASYVRDLVTGVGPPQVGTVGRIELHPNLVNVVAARASITVDVRNTDDDVLGDVERRIADRAEDIAADEGVEIAAETLARFAPVEFDESVVSLVEDVAGGLGHSTRRLPAGAGHDAQMMARICPAGMIFVPSVGGISHNPAEHTDAADLEAGANVLLRTMLRLANEVAT